MGWGCGKGNDCEWTQPGRELAGAEVLPEFCHAENGQDSELNLRSDRICCLAVDVLAYNVRSCMHDHVILQPWHDLSWKSTHPQRLVVTATIVGASKLLYSKTLVSHDTTIVHSQAESA